MGITVLCPNAGRPAAVVVTGSGPAGILCARGTIVEFFGKNAVRRVATAGISVQLAVFKGTLMGPQVPADPPYGAVAATITGQDWICRTVPAPDSTGSGSGGAPLTLGAWEMGPSGVIDRQITQFLGVQAAAVDCCFGTGTGSGFSAPRAASAGTAAVAFAPAVWSLAVTGLAAPVAAALNGTWLLHLRDPDGLTTVWENGGDGVASPRVQLVCESPPDGLWRLRLEHKVVALEYTAPAAAWEAVGPLTLTAEPPAPFPCSLTVMPA